MTDSRVRESTSHRSGGRFAELLKVQAKLALREPYGLLSIAEIFALGLVLVALSPTQTVARVVSGPVVFVSMFLSGLWVQPALVGDPLRTIMYYSPTGAAARALLDAVFTGSPSYAALLTMAVYTVLFGFIAIRYFRWE